MKRIVIILISIFISLFIGLSGALFQGDALVTWYPELNKSALTPAGFVFPIAWTILYVLIGLSMANVLIRRATNKDYLLLLWWVQMMFNFLWSIFFFYMRNPLLGLIDLVLLDVVVLIYIVIGYRSSRLSSLLFIPYLLWLLFATYLNGYVVMNNFNYLL